MSMHTSLRRTAASVPSSTSSILPLSQLSSQSKATTFICSQCRHATLLRRPKRPYTFSQLITLSDGSAFVHRTTSPPPSKLMNVEDDEAGRLAAFRARFGRGFDANAPAEADAAKSPEEKKAAEEARKAQEAADQEEEDNLLDLISSFGQQEAPPPEKKKRF
ncbi:hypothetical protein N7468_010209 [Penicillium chermesinum]|uniref:Uncharacterized protein n=1 Tax=Penicillium chermesinum TaxID=63820 RepID=A0A9W9NC98_9EURO|nr:uncharacterized protein N7468_010209 [Penicillium chermesinum]KAJ5217201.1 hypothetical protein N7468_010209 [Penicillium chermesinum]